MTDYLQDNQCVPEVTNRWNVSYSHTAELGQDKETVNYSVVWTLTDNYGIVTANGGRGRSFEGDDIATGIAQGQARTKAEEFDREYDLPAPFTTKESF